MRLIPLAGNSSTVGVLETDPGEIAQFREKIAVLCRDTLKDTQGHPEHGVWSPKLNLKRESGL